MKMGDKKGREGGGMMDDKEGGVLGHRRGKGKMEYLPIVQTRPAASISPSCVTSLFLHGVVVDGEPTNLSARPR
jgi:hypothetical protein